VQARPWRFPLNIYKTKKKKEKKKKLCNKHVREWCGLPHHLPRSAEVYEKKLFTFFKTFD